MQHCQHIFASGYTCRAVALRNERFCYFHTATRDRLRRQRIAARRNLPLQLPVLEDRAAVQLAVGDTINAMLSGRLDRKTAALTLYALQIASSNLKGRVEDRPDYPYKEYSPELDASLPDIDAETIENLPENAEIPPNIAEISTESREKSAVQSASASDEKARRVPPKKPVQSAPSESISKLAQLVKALKHPRAAERMRAHQDAANRAKHPEEREKKASKAAASGS